MAFLYIQPRYRAFLHRHGLVRAEDFLRLSGVIYGGHPNRNVARITIGEGEQMLAAFLKKEHRVRWRDRLANAWAGFGFVSKSVREMKMLIDADTVGVDGPSVIAAGEADGQAFLLLDEVSDAVELSQVLQNVAGTLRVPSACRGTRSVPATLRRRALARALGRSLARLHDAGFVHGDLFAKHVLVKEAAEPEVLFIDWQRGRRHPQLSWRQRAGDVAALDATLADDLATPMERLRFLHEYWRESWATKQTQRLMLNAVRRRSALLQRRRKTREMRQTAIAAGRQNLIWLDGEALCVTRDFLAATRGVLPAWLRPGDFSACNTQSRAIMHDLPGIGTVRLVERRSSHLWTWVGCRLRRRRYNTPEFEQARALFRLERFGIAVPKLLAVGQRFSLPWQGESFVLTAPVAGTVSLKHTLSVARNAHARNELLREAGAVLRRIHEAGYVAGTGSERAFLLHEELQQLVINPAEGLSRVGKVCRRRILADLRSLVHGFSLSLTQTLRLLRGYFGRQRLTGKMRSCFRAAAAASSPTRDARAMSSMLPDRSRTSAQAERQVCA